ncbi:hypothetical protein BH06580 [Bartonella henselae str. Houston-1]|uniref:Uncharacterized protein n=1 Tax=Bartonella henselae (strain ATCC 49882 / DSM 28221 / CCUG 30454 / Houston 1) TaxID=283166 RepID=A0A0H3LWZ6_BARHE|nr:hypothetical protein BH06580 [Bartonella henselae str. Houston-1]
MLSSHESDTDERERASTSMFDKKEKIAAVKTHEYKQFLNNLTTLLLQIFFFSAKTKYNLKNNKYKINRNKSLLI